MHFLLTKTHDERDTDYYEIINYRKYCMTLPKTNIELQSSNKHREKDNFFYLVRLQKADDVTHIHVDPDLPVVARNDKLRDEANSEDFSSTVLSRSDVKSGNHDLGDNIRTLGVGIFPWIRTPDGENRLVLLQKDKDAPSPLAYMQPAGLVAGDNPMFALFREATEETAIITVDDEAQILTVQSFYLPEETDLLDKTTQNEIIGKKHGAIENIRKNLDKHYPEYSNYEIKFSEDPLQTKAVENSQSENVVFHLPDGTTIKARGMVCDDEKKHSIDFSLIVMIDLSKFKKVINIDPEPFCRVPKLATKEEAKALEIVTTPLGSYLNIIEYDHSLDQKARPVGIYKHTEPKPF